jgi:hypothetical protein
VVDYFRPQRVILFGSRARGDATRDSDIDLLVIVDDDTPDAKLGWKAGREAHRSRHAADVFLCAPKPSSATAASPIRLPPEADADGIVVLWLAQRTVHEDAEPERPVECGRALAASGRARSPQRPGLPGGRSAFA